MTAAEKALELIADGMILGLGTGRAATAFIHALGTRVQAGLRIRGVPTSQASDQLARQLGIPLVELREIEQIDIDVDGADEVDPQLNLIKGLGGALVREKIVAASSRKVVILVGPEKLSPQLGTRGVLPVEVVPFGVPLCQRKLAALGIPSQVRQTAGSPFISDNHNLILDCQLQPVADPADLARRIGDIPGVVDTGMFLGMADVVIVEDGGQVQVKTRLG
ncbi:MAG: ribose-5-phosphate isomerase RpiA [Planctomycetia bacterium]|nr:ribose-5-phosphate isomerase RpiA [Planctomycetia bacterium]